MSDTEEVLYTYALNQNALRELLEKPPNFRFSIHGLMNYREALRKVTRRF